MTTEETRTDGERNVDTDVRVNGSAPWQAPSVDAAAAVPSANRASWRRRRWTPGDILSRYGLLLAWAIVIAVFAVLSPSVFFTVSNFQTIFGSQAILLLLSLALLIPLAAGEFDLSVAGVLGISFVLVGYFNINDGWPVGLAALVALGCGTAVGFVNAFLIVGLGVESIVVTLGIGTLLIGVGYGITTGPIVGVSQSLVSIADNRVFGLPLQFYYALALTVTIWYVFSYTPLGRYIYFVGANRSVSRLSGIRVDMIRVGALVSGSFISALTGVILAGSLGSSAPNVAESYLLPAFAAVFLGATTIQPGRFNPWGTFIAVYFLVTGITGLEIQGLVGWIEQVFYGGSLVVAVAFSRLLSLHRIGGDG